METGSDHISDRRGSRPGSEGVRPNTFQTPNLYVDQLMAYLTPEEFKVLVYATRRIMGFHKRQDRIAFSQFCTGTVARDGQVLDRGTGMHEKTVRTALKGLSGFRILLRVAENDPRVNSGAEFGLQEDTAAIDMEGLMRRAEGWSRKPPEAEVVPSQGNTPRRVGGTLAGEHGGTLRGGEGGTLAGDPQKKGKERENQEGEAGAYTLSANSRSNRLVDRPAPYQPAPPAAASQTSEPDPLFANPAGPPPQGTDPLKKAINDALFVYCDETDRWGWLNQLAETCRRYQAAGRPFRVEQLAVAATKGRAAWYAEGKTTRPKFLNCFLDALTIEVSAAEKAVRDREEWQREREAMKRYTEGRAEMAAQAQQIQALRAAAVTAGPDTPEWETCALFLGGGQRRRMSDSLLLKWWQDAQPPPTAAQIAADPILRAAYGRQTRA